MRKKLFDSLVMEIDAEIEQILSSFAGEPDDAPHRVLELKLYRFFQELLHLGEIKSLDTRSWGETSKSIIIQEIQDVAKKTPGHEGFSSSCFRGFNTSTLANVYMTPHNCAAIRSAFPRTNQYSAAHNARIREIWNDNVGAPENWTPHFLKRMTRDNDPPTDVTNCPLIGDYLLFRADEAGYARPAFFRFYPHEIGERIRSMGLRLDRQYMGLSSKGWVIKQQNGYMVGGYIINRRSTGDIEIDGGFSLMSVSDDQQSDLVQMSGRVLAMAPVLHMQMPYVSGPSCSRGILIRLHNSKDHGGQRSETKTERLESTLALHEDLTKKFGNKLRLRDVARILEDATGIGRHYFYQDNRMKDDEIPHSEAFVNTSFQEDSDAFAPLKVTEIREKSGYPVRGNIGIDFEKPHPLFRG